MVVWDIRRQHTNSGHVINNLAALKEGISWAEFRLIYQPTTLTEEEFGAVCQTVYLEGNMLYVVEEADTFATPAYINDDFNKCINWGRMRGLGVISISRRPANLHKNCLSEINHLLLFHIHLPNDTDYLKKFVPPAAVDEAMNLGLYEFIYWPGGTHWYRHSPLPYLA